MDTKKIDKTKILMTNGSLMKVKSIAFCNAFDLHYTAIISLEKQFLVFLRVAILHGFYFTGFSFLVQSTLSTVIQNPFYRFFATNLTLSFMNIHAKLHPL